MKTGFCFGRPHERNTLTKKTTEGLQGSRTVRDGLAVIFDESKESLEVCRFRRNLEVQNGIYLRWKRRYILAIDDGPETTLLGR